mgnify:FL=1
MADTLLSPLPLLMVVSNYLRSFSSLQHPSSHVPAVPESFLSARLGGLQCVPVSDWVPLKLERRSMAMAVIVY